MRIISWNVNGLRATYKNGYLFPLLEKEKPDIFCVQETKAEPEQLPDEVRNIAGYYSYFNWSKKKKGYSGVAIYTKIKPEKVEYNMGIKKFDDEGRMIVAYYSAKAGAFGGKEFVLINVYFPQGGQEGRLVFKLEFYDEFLKFVERLRKSHPNIIFCGDVNTAHEATDLAHPKENEENTGFLPEERAWLDEVINLGYIDVFRYFYPNKTSAYTYWDMKTFARDRNVGWRLDYFFITPELKIKNTDIMDEYYGSDHCPIWLEI